MATNEKNIGYKPTDGLSYDPAEDKYWDSIGLNKEIERTFEICHGCRLCFKYCDSFPTLFSLLDKKYDGDVRQVTPAETTTIMDSCFQCKLCEVQCPYTERDGHEFRLVRRPGRSVNDLSRPARRPQKFVRDDSNEWIGIRPNDH